MSELEAQGVLAGTDKSAVHSYGWDYLRHYDDLFRPWKSQDINLIEIGVEQGASLEIWLKYFERATIVGIDINPKCLRLARDRAVIKIGSQENPEFLHKVAAQYPPTIVVDDGSHMAHHMIASFEALFPALAPGGLYVLEDTAFHFEDGVGQWQGAKTHQGLSDRSLYEYFSPFFRARLANLNTPPDSWGFARYAFENIDSVLAFGGALAIRKRKPRAIEEEAAAIERLLPDAANVSAARRHYAAFLMKHNLRLDRAYELMKQVCDAMSDDKSALERMFILSTWNRRFDEAVFYAERLAALRPADAQSWRMASDAYRNLSRRDAELDALQRLLSLEPSSANSWLRLSALQEQRGDRSEALAAARKAVEFAPQDAQAAIRLKALEAEGV